MKKPLVLIVDDELMHLNAILDAIEDEDFDCDVFSALNGKTAFEIAKKELPDLIITDWEMPEMNGIELIRELKKHKETSNIPVIMCTGIMTSSKNLETALSTGAVDYIRKPIDSLELIARTKANLHLSEKYKEIKTLNTNLTEKYEEIKKLNEVKDRILSVISHDVRGPVGTLKLLVDIILKNIHKYSIEKTEGLIEKLSKQSGSVYAILQNLLIWANSQRKNIIYEPSYQFITKSIDENITLLNCDATHKGISLLNKVPSDLKAHFDNNLISIVIRNLMNNAIKFTSPGGSVTLDAERGDKFHIIKISDTGVGISPDRVTKLFDKTTYESTFGTDSEKGSGLGLKLCLELIEIHGGKIWVESKEGKGSNFYFTLPAL